MKKNLLFGALFALALGTQAQTPILHAYFDADGIKLKGSAAEDRTAGAINTGANYTFSLLNPIRNEYLGCTNVGTTSSSNGNGFYYIMFNRDDAFGEAMKGDFTAEMLFRNDSKNAISQTSSSKGSSNYTCKFLSCTQAGGWGIKYYPGPWDADRTGFAGISTEYSINDEGTNAYISAVSGEDNGHIETGKFYHVVAVYNKSEKKISLYMNNVKIAETEDDRMANETNFPNIGTTRYQEGMWIAMGADPANNSTPDVNVAENSNRSTFVFTKFYDKALNAEEVANCYKDEQVQYYVNSKPTTTSDIIWDVVAEADGEVYDASPYKQIDVTGEITTQWNDAQKRYESVWTGVKENMAYRAYGYDQSITARLDEGMAIEVYAAAGSTTIAATQSPLSFQQDGGIGFEFNNANAIKFNYNQNGYLLTGGGAKALSITANKALEDTDYHHYLLTKKFNETKIYIDGVLDKTYSLEEGTDVYSPELQSTKYSYAPYQMFVYGGDASSKMSASCDFPWIGNISIARVWGKAMTDEDAAALYAQATNTRKAITVGAAGCAATVLPFAAVVPEGVEVYVIESETETEASAALYAKTGDVIPYGTPVIVKAAAGSYVFPAADLTTQIPVAAPATNLLVGSFATKKVAANEVATLGDNEFQPAAAGVIPAMSAWLPTNAAKQVKYGTVTAVSSVKTSADKDVYFDLQGRKIQNPTRGLYIKNGQKIFVK